MKNKKKKNKSTLQSSSNRNWGIIVFLLIILATFTPRLLAYDSNATKFLAISIANIFIFLYILIAQTVELKRSLGVFYSSKVGIFLTLFLIGLILSIASATNAIESLLQTAKIFTIYFSVILIFISFSNAPKAINSFIIIASIILLIDSLSVFFSVFEFIQGNLSGILEIRSIYSNKNILAAAIFVKLPFAYWLLIKGSKRTRKIGWWSLFFGFAALFFMATRVFYVGIIILSMLIISHLATSYFFTKRKEILSSLMYYSIALIFAFIVFSGTQRYLYPKENLTRYTMNVSDQLATISISESSLAKRLTAWEWSWMMLKEEPILGIGTGNWKINVLKFENKTKDDYYYIYKAHNDFVEIITETGILGGIFYLGIFIIVFFSFFIHYWHSLKRGLDSINFVFLAGLGLLCYSLDAFFNFPIDRPEIAILFAVYLGILIMHHTGREIDPPKKIVSDAPSFKKLIKYLLGPTYILFLIFSVYVLFLNYLSVKTQRVVYNEIKSNTLISSSQEVIDGFPFIPNITIFGQPIGVHKARYLMNEGAYSDAINILKKDKSSPWDGRREHFMALGYNYLNLIDSALLYAEKARAIKPNYLDNFILNCFLLEKQQRMDEAYKLIDSYLSANPGNNKAMEFGIKFYLQKNDIDKAWETISYANTILPQDTFISNWHQRIYQAKFIEPFGSYYNKSYEFYSIGQYDQALENINSFIESVPGNYDAHHLRAFIYYSQNHYRKCIDEITYALSLKSNTGDLYNLRGVCYRAINDMEKACADFRKASSMGDEAGKINYGKYCK